jgi:hypothetical protein
VVLGVGDHINRRSYPVGHVVEAGHVGNVEDVGVGEAFVPQGLPVVFAHPMRGDGQLPGEIQHGAVACGQVRHAIIHHQHLAQLRIARQFPHRLTMGDEAIVAVVGGGDDHGDHLALQFVEPAVTQHQFVVELDEGTELFWARAVGSQDVGHQPQLVLAFGEICLQVVIQGFRVRHGKGHGVIWLRQGYLLLKGWRVDDDPSIVRRCYSPI